MSAYVGRRISLEELERLARDAVRAGGWRAQGVTLHHTAAPSLAQRPYGLSARHLRNLWQYYTRTLGWRGGPHLFTDDKGICLLQRLDRRGTHATSFNATRWGIEVLGWYDRGRDDPFSGRGLRAWQHAAQAARILAEALGDDSPRVGRGKTINFHRHDPRTRKTCPGDRITESWVRELLAAGVDAPQPAGWRVLLNGGSWPGPIMDLGSRVLIRRADAAPLIGWARAAGMPVEHIDMTGAGWSHVRALGLPVSVEGKTISMTTS